jgi:hypothetical protein
LGGVGGGAAPHRRPTQNLAAKYHAAIAVGDRLK